MHPKGQGEALSHAPPHGDEEEPAEVARASVWDSSPVRGSSYVPPGGDREEDPGHAGRPRGGDWGSLLRLQVRKTKMSSLSKQRGIALLLITVDSWWVLLFSVLPVPLKGRKELLKTFQVFLRS